MSLADELHHRRPARVETVRLAHEEPERVDLVVVELRGQRLAVTMTDQSGHHERAVRHLGPEVLLQLLYVGHDALLELSCRDQPPCATIVAGPPKGAVSRPSVRPRSGSGRSSSPTL